MSVQDLKHLANHTTPRAGKMLNTDDDSITPRLSLQHDMARRLRNKQRGLTGLLRRFTLKAPNSASLRARGTRARHSIETTKHVILKRKIRNFATIVYIQDLTGLLYCAIRHTVKILKQVQDDRFSHSSLTCHYLQTVANMLA